MSNEIVLKKSDIELVGKHRAVMAALNKVKSQMDEMSSDVRGDSCLIVKCSIERIENDGVDEQNECDNSDNGVEDNREENLDGGEEFDAGAGTPDGTTPDSPGEDTRQDEVFEDGEGSEISNDPIDEVEDKFADVIGEISEDEDHEDDEEK